MPFGLENTFDFLKDDIQDQLSQTFEVGWQDAPSIQRVTKAYLVKLDAQGQDKTGPDDKAYFQFNPSDLNLGEFIRVPQTQQPAHGRHRLAHGQTKFVIHMLFDTSDTGK